jgi:biopolymer transport protein ExbD
MNFRPHHFEESTFQIAPLIDIVFNLLFFFLALSIFYQIELQIGITLPETENADPGRVYPNQVVVNVDPEGRYFINQREFTAQQLSDLLSQFGEAGAQQTVIVRGDRSTPYEYIVEVLDLCRGAGVVDYALATLPEESGAAGGI